MFPYYVFSSFFPCFLLVFPGNLFSREFLSPTGELDTDTAPGMWGAVVGHWNQQAESLSPKACCCRLSLQSPRRPRWRSPCRHGQCPSLPSP